MPNVVQCVAAHPRASGSRRNAAALMARIVCFCVIFSGLCATTLPAQQPASVQPPADNGGEAKRDIEKTLNTLIEGGRVGGDPQLMLKQFDINRLVDYVLEQSGTEMNFIERVQFGNGLKQSMLRSLPPMLQHYEKVEIGRIDVDPDGNSAKAMVRFFLEDGSSDRRRFWMWQVNKTWRVEDWEEISMGWRLSTVSGALLADMQKTQRLDNEKILQLREFSQLVNDVNMALYNGDPIAAYQQLDALRNAVIPPALETLRWTLVGAVLQHNGLAQEALDALANVTTQPHPPLVDLLRGGALRDLERYDEALDPLQRYMHVCGEDAVALSIVGECQRLSERNDLAIDAFRRGLADAPDFADNLYGLLVTVPRTPAWDEELLQHVQRLRKPEEVLVMIGEQLVGEGNYDPLDTLVHAYRKLHPDVPDVTYYQACVQYGYEEYRRAIDLLLPLLADVDQDRQPAYLWLYADSAVSDGSALEQLRRLPNELKAAGFEEMATIMRDQGVWDMLREFLDGAGADAPDNHLVPLFRAALSAADHRYRKAYRLLRAALAKTDDPAVVEAHQWQLRHYAIQGGLAREFYESADDRLAVLPELMNDILGVDRFDQAEAVLELHRRLHPQDPHSDYYQSQVLLRHDRFDEANELLSKVLASPQFPESMHEAARYDLVVGLFRLGKAAEAYSRLENGDEIVFEQLADLYMEAADGAGLEQLVQLHQQKVGTTDMSTTYAAQAAFMQQQYEQAVKLLEVDDLAGNEVTDWQAQYRLHVMARSLLHLGAHKRAVEYADRFESGDYYRALSFAMQGDAPRAQEYVQKCLDSGTSWASEFLDDEILQPLLEKKEFASLKQFLEQQVREQGY